LVWRASLAVVSAGAVAFGLVWAVELALGAGADSVYDSVRVLGLLGVLAWTLGGSSGLFYARTTARPWLVAMAGALIFGLLLFAAWTDMYDLTGCG
jgi:hypothetical protein